MSSRNSLLDRTLPRWRAPLLSQRKPARVTDQAAQTLEALARTVLRRVPVVLGGVTAALQAPVQQRGYVDIPEIRDRAWCFSHLNLEIFCVIDERSEREVLSLIVGGSPARRLTQIERSIIGESMSRILRSQAEPLEEFCEEPRKRPPAHAWSCNVELSGLRTQATFQLFTACAPPPPIAFVGPNLADVPLQIRATFPAIACAIADVSGWRTGSLLSLRRPDREVCALLYAGGRRVATAKLGTLFGERAVQLIQVQPCTL